MALPPVSYHCQAMIPWDEYLDYKISPHDPATLKHAGMTGLMAGIADRCPSALRLRDVGRSFEGRSVWLASVGNGTTQILLWSQMHGDEPTHVAVLLDLMSFLAAASELSVASDILAGCTLHIVPMLNPDGVECWTRRNAQHIDVNRDARQLASPEGRILHSIVEELRPHFAFNLHNQHRRAAVGGTLQPAAVSLLVPLPDSDASDTESTVRAKRVAASIVHAVEATCGGAVSRYRAEFMPRAFGEMIQRREISTVLIEAGWWRGRRPADLVQLHFTGLLSALHAIATDRLLDFETSIYENLPLSAEHRLFDVMLKNVTVVNGLDHATFTCDVGIVSDQSHHPRPDTHITSATIEDIGDLAETSADIIFADSAICMPGRTTFDEEITPLQLPSLKRCIHLLHSGITTVIGQVDIFDKSQVERFAELSQQERFPLHIGFVARLDAATISPHDIPWKSLLEALGHGALAVLVEGQSAELSELLQRINVAVGGRDELLAGDLASRATTILEAARRNRAMAERLSLGHLARIRCGASPDILLLSSPAADIESMEFHPSQIRHVLVSGLPAISEGVVVCENAGRFLRRPPLNSDRH